MMFFLVYQAVQSLIKLINKTTIEQKRNMLSILVRDTQIYICVYFIMCLIMSTIHYSLSHLT